MGTKSLTKKPLFRPNTMATGVRVVEHTAVVKWVRERMYRFRLGRNSKRYNSPRVVVRQKHRTRSKLTTPPSPNLFFFTEGGDETWISALCVPSRQ